MQTPGISTLHFEQSHLSLSELGMKTQNGLATSATPCRSFRYRFKRSGHINVNEARVYKSWIKSQAKSEPCSRFVGLLDSRVTIGATAKGRSSSFAISRILQGSLAYIVGSDLYPGCIHCNSKDNRSDGPSRGRPVDPPTKEPPRWLTELEGGRTDCFDVCVEASKFSKNPARWLRMLLLLSGDIEPHPGPRAARGPLDLQVGFVPVTASRMEKCFAACRKWVEVEANLSSLAPSFQPGVKGLKNQSKQCQPSSTNSRKQQLSKTL